ncbi:methyltransferase domain-containing protein [Altererythrobacter sp. CAU 1778]
MKTTTPPLIFSPQRRKAAWRRSVARQGPDAANFLARDMADEVEERLGFMRHEPQRVLVIGDMTGALTDAFPDADLSQAAPTTLDEENPFPRGGYDLIVSMNTLATVNDLPGALVHYRAALAEGGLMIAQFVGLGSLQVLRSALLAADGERPAARIHPMVDVRGGAELLQRAGFRRQVADSRTLQVRYRHFDRLIADLRDQGLANQLADTPPPLSRQSRAAARAAFMNRADTEGRVTEFFEIVTLTGWKS